MILLLMGVSGSGKTTVGRLLAENLAWKFVDADDYHPPANKEKMHRDIPLTDADRAPWLATLRQLIDQWHSSGENVVLACSALKQSYRDQLGFGHNRPPELILAYLKGSIETIRQRIAHRREHFMNPDLLQSQFDALEEPRDAILVDVGPPSEEIADELASQ